MFKKRIRCDYINHMLQSASQVLVSTSYINNVLVSTSSIDNLDVMLESVKVLHQ